MAQRNILISYYDWTQDPSATIVGGAWEANIPASNMFTIQPQLVSQSTGGSVTFDINLGGVRNIRFVNLQNLGVDPGALIQVSFGAYNSGVVPAWATDANGLYSPSEFIALGRQRIFVADKPQSTSTITVTITGSTAPVQIGYVGAHEAWEPPYNLSYGWRTTYLDDSDIQRVPFGSTYVTLRARRRRISFGLDWIPDDRVYVGGINYVPIARAIASITGASVPIMVIPFPDDPDNLSREAIWGLNSNAPEISNPFYARYAMTFQIDELV